MKSHPRAAFSIDWLNFNMDAPLSAIHFMKVDQQHLLLLLVLLLCEMIEKDQFVTYHETKGSLGIDMKAIYIIF